MRWRYPKPNRSCWLVAGCCLLIGASEATVTDIGWPREFKNDRARLVVYQPQIESWESYRTLKARAAIGVTPPGATKPVYGVLFVTAETRTDMNRRTVLVGKIAVTDARFPSSETGATAGLTAVIRDLIPSEPIRISMDRIIAGLDRTKAATRETPVSLAPPPIYTSQSAAILVIIDGKPALSEVWGTNLQYVVNTNWDLFYHPRGGRYYLLNGSMWLTSAEIAGPWTATAQLPREFSELPAAENGSRVKEQVPAKPVTTEAAPVVFTSDRPAELIVTAGKPHVKRAGETRLFYTVNTKSDLFFHERDRLWYFLTSGRWFRSNTGQSDWSSVGNDALPPEFAQIPSDHAKAHVRVAVQGTREAEDAVLLANIPRTATVDRSRAKAEVRYAGEPEFKAIEGTRVAYAVNTSSDVLRVGDRYYLCFQGVWFVSTSAKGPWQVADQVAPEIYTIPVSSPKYHVTYVQVYESTPTTVVVGYTSGYTGVYAYGGTVYYGTGYYSPSYVSVGVYSTPVYYGYPYYTYGVAATYSAAIGTYARGAAVYGPCGGYGAAAAYNPTTGTYARGAAAWGPNGAAAGGSAYNPVTGQ